MNATGSFARTNAIRHVDDTLLDERYFEYLFPQSQHLPSEHTPTRYRQPMPDYGYQNQAAFPPSHVWDLSTMYDAQPYSMPPTSASTYLPTEAPLRLHTPGYLPSPPETYQPSSPSHMVSSTSSPSIVPSPCAAEPAIRHSEFSSAIRGPRRVQHANMPLDPRSFGAYVQLLMSWSS